MNAKIEGSLAEGRALLASDRPGDAALVFERVLLVAPDAATARAGLEEARRAVAERERALEVERAAGDAVPPPRDERRLADDAASALRPRWLTRRLGSRADTPETPAPARRISSRSRAVLGSACAMAFVALGLAVASNWNGLMRHLTRVPVPRESGVALSSLPAARAEDQTIAAARRLLDAGEPARAVALLDSVSPDQPAYPFARQLRGHAERAMRQGATRAGALSR